MVSLPLALPLVDLLLQPVIRRAAAQVRIQGMRFIMGFKC